MRALVAHTACGTRPPHPPPSHPPPPSSGKYEGDIHRKELALQVIMQMFTDINASITANKSLNFQHTMMKKLGPQPYSAELEAADKATRDMYEAMMRKMIQAIDVMKTAMEFITFKP